jgi:serine phosphatase RsbU (regulator of sigma subunit)/PAS domain-containing protein
LSGVYAQAVGYLSPAAGEAARSSVDRAVGLLAGRARCRLAEAHRHLLRTAAERHQDVAEVAASVLRLLDTADPATDPGHAESLPGLVTSALSGSALSGSALSGSAPLVAPVRRFEPWLAMVQQVLDVMPGMSAYLTPERDGQGALTDLIWAAVSPGAVAPNGLRGARLIGLRTSHSFASVVGSDRWPTYQSVLDTGCPADVGPFPSGDGLYSVRAHRLGHGLLLNWTRQAAEPAGEAARIAGTERLANLGWGEWDLVSGEIYWSPQLYRIYQRDPLLGPLSRAESEAIAVADDEPLRTAALHAFERQETVDITTRVRLGGRVKHLRTIADAVRDAAGHPLRVYGIVQDVTDSEAGARRLAEVERQLDEQRRTLAAKHEMAAELQRIILPMPSGPIELPGIKVAVRYLPAGQESLVGGDWYHAAELRDGSVLLAVGDVAGHGTPAATTMAQLRHALRALAITTDDPGALLGHLNRLTCDLERETPELSATAVIARFDPVRREILWAQAGHPPPLLSRAGRTAPLGRPPGPILGVVEDAVYPTARLDFRVGDLLLLYTDGLVEHRRRGLDDGLATVIAAVDDAVRASPQQPLAQVLSRLRQANPDDDTCILAARPVTGETRDLRGYLAQR